MPNSSQNILHIYCRVSTEIQVATGHSLLAQENAGITKAKSLGLSHRIHVEKAKSGTSDDVEFKNRPVLKALLDLCDEGFVTDIFVTEQDRLSRSPLATFFIKRILIENNINLHTINQTIHLQDPEQSFVADLTSLLAKRERDIFVKRSKRGVIEAAKKGRWPGVILPYGYRRDSNRIIEIDPEEAKIYLQMVDLSLAGNGTNTIANRLNELEIETRCKKVLPNGTKVKNKATGLVRQVHNEDFVWRAGTIYCILTNSIHKGERKFKNEIIPIPAIIDNELWERVQLNLKQNKNCSSNHATHFYLLKGKLRCAKCGANLYGKIKSDERIYMCSSKRQLFCGLRSLNLDRLNDTIWNLLINNKIRLSEIKDELKSINAPNKLKELNGKKSGIENQIIAVEKRREKLIILFEKDKISMEEFENRSITLANEKDELTKMLQLISREINQFSKRISLMEKSLKDSEILTTINSWGNNEKKALIDRKIKNIIVYWNESVWQHIMEVTVETSGYFVTQYCALKASNKPKAVIPKDLSIVEMQQLINSTALKIPHHGIETAQKFLT